MSLKNFVRRTMRKARALPENVPVPVRLPWGGWFLAWNDVMGKNVRRRSFLEEAEQAFVRRFLAPGMTVFDVGAHQGLYTMLSSRSVGSAGRVTAFEPSPRERCRLRWNLLLNRCGNVRVEGFAAGNGEGKARLFVCQGEETGCNSLRAPVVSEKVRTVEVRMITLDRYVQLHEIRRLDFIKLDVEGAELDVLRGARNLLGRFQPLVLCELADIRTRPWGYPSAEIFSRLAGCGYRWFSFGQDGGLVPSPKKEHFHENLLAVPEAKLALIESHLAERRTQVSAGL
jgi:FkbM family methyltransferase